MNENIYILQNRNKNKNKNEKKNREEEQGDVDANCSRIDIWMELNYQI